MTLKRAIITFIILELCQVVALSGLKIADNISTNALEAQSSEAAEQISEILEDIETTAEPTSTQIENTASPTADNTVTTSPADKIITITIAKDILSENIDFIISQANELDINIAIDDTNIVYSFTRAGQSALIENTAEYINDTLSKQVSIDDNSINAIVYDDNYTMLTIIADIDENGTMPDTRQIEGYFLLYHLLDGAKIDEIDLSVSIQDASTNEILSEYSHQNTVDETEDN